MIKNLVNISKLNTAVFNRTLVSSSKTTPKNDADAEFEYQNDKSSGIKNLERIGLAKKAWSWPQYNRVIYPPTEDGKPMINPVRILFSHLIAFEKFFFLFYLILLFLFSLFIICVLS